MGIGVEDAGGRTWSVAASPSASAAVTVAGGETERRAAEEGRETRAGEELGAGIVLDCSTSE